MSRRKKREQLVTQHLENLSRRALEEYQDVIREFVRRRHGIYALYRKDRLYYVGLASNLGGRLKTHLRDRHGDAWDRFSVYLTVNTAHMRELEALILRTIKASGNRQKGKFLRSEDLKRAFRRKVTEKIKRVVDEMVGRLRVSSNDGERRDGGAPQRLARHAPAPLRATYKGREFRARLRRDGSIRWNGDVFESPSAAAMAVVRRRGVNGWWFWTIERSPGLWVRLRELKR